VKQNYTHPKTTQSKAKVNIWLKEEQKPETVLTREAASTILCT
jgi:hypothetical protein